MQTISPLDPNQFMTTNQKPVTDAKAPSLYKVSGLAKSYNDGSKAGQCTKWASDVMQKAGFGRALSTGLKTNEDDTVDFKKSKVNSTTPTVGSAIALDNGTKYGHWGIVTGIKPDGSVIYKSSNEIGDERVSTGSVSSGSGRILGYFDPNSKNKPIMTTTKQSNSFDGFGAAPIPDAVQIKEPNFDDMSSVDDFFLQNGFDIRDKAAADGVMSKFGVSKDDALKVVAKAKYGKLTKANSAEGNFEATQRALRGGAENASPSKASEMGRFGIPSQSIDWMGRPEALPKEQVDAARAELDALPGGMNEAYSKIDSFTPAQKEALLGMMKEQYANSDENSRELITSNIRSFLAKMAPSSYEKDRLEQQVFGIAGPSTDNPILRGITAFNNAGMTALDTVGFNPVRGIMESSEKLGTASSGWEAANALMQGIGAISTANPVGAVVSSGLNNLAKTDVGASIIRSAMAIPEKGADILVSAMDVPEDQRADAIALIRDVIISGSLRGTIGAYSGAKAGFNASPAASAAGKLSSALKTGAKEGAVEFGKGIIDPFKVTIPSSKPGSSVSANKLIGDAEKRVNTAVKNEKSISPTNKRINKEGIVDAAEGMSKLRELGVDLGKKNLENIDAEVASAKEAVFSKFDEASKDVPVQFDKNQLRSGVEALVSKKLKGGISDATQSAINEIVDQIDVNLTRNGKTVADMATVHKLTSKLYDVIVKATESKGVLRTDTPLVLLAVKEVLYRQMESVPGFAKYIDDYRNLSRVEDITRLMKDKFGTDVMNKGVSEIVPASWTGIFAGAAGSGNWGIAASAALASLVSFGRQLKKSPTNLFNDIKLVSEAIDKYGQGGADALRQKMGIVKEPRLGTSAPDITQFPSAKKVQEANMNEKFPSNEPGIDVDKYQAPSKAFMNQQFEAMRPKPMKEPGTPVEPTYSPSKAEVEAALNPKPAKKAPAPKTAPAKKVEAKPAKKPAVAPKKAVAATKASKPVSKPSVAPKAKETAKKAIPSKTQSVEEYVKGVKLSEEVNKELKKFVNELVKYGSKEQSDAIAKVAKIGARELAGLLQHADPITGLYMELSEALAKKLKK